MSGRTERFIGPVDSVEPFTEPRCAYLQALIVSNTGSDQVRQLLHKELSRNKVYQRVWQAATDLKGARNECYIAVTSYTLGMMPDVQFQLYKDFNSKCRQLRDLESWNNFQYKSLYCLLMRAAARVTNNPPTSTCLYRGVDVHFPPDRFKDTGYVCFSQFTSATPNRHHAKGFANGKGTLFEFPRGAAAAMGIADHSAYPHEKEVVIFPWSTFRVKEVDRSGPVHRVVLESAGPRMDLTASGLVLTAQGQHGQSHGQSKGHHGQSQSQHGKTQGQPGQSKGEHGQSQGQHGQSKGEHGQHHGQGQHGQSHGQHGQSQGQHGQSKSHHGQSQGQHGQYHGHGQHGQSKSHHGQSEGQHGQSKSNHGQSQGQHGQSKGEHGQHHGQGQHGQSHGQHGQSQGQHGQSKSHHGQSKSQHGQSQGHHGESKGQHGQHHGQGHHGQSQGQHGQSQGHHGKSQGGTEVVQYFPKVDGTIVAKPQGHTVKIVQYKGMPLPPPLPLLPVIKHHMGQAKSFDQQIQSLAKKMVPQDGKGCVASLQFQKMTVECDKSKTTMTVQSLHVKHGQHSKDKKPPFY